MVRFAFGLSAVIWLTTPLAAAQQSDNPPAAKTQTIKVSKAFALRAALSAATGLHEQIVGQGASQSVAHVLYSIDSTARWALNDDLVALNAGLEKIDKAIADLQKQAAAENGGAPVPLKDRTKEQDAIVERFKDDVNKRSEETVEIPALFHVRRGDFKEALTGEILAPMQEAGIIDP